MDYPKSVPGVGLVDGKFIDENTTTGQVGSLIPSSWGDAVTDEILAVIQAAGLEPDEHNNGQLLQAISALLSKATPEATVDILGLVKQATQAEAEDGLDTKKSMSALRVHQAITKRAAAVVISTAASKVLVANDLGLVLADATAAAMNITLPAANAALGVRDVIIRRVDNGGNRLTVTAAGADKIKFHTHLRVAGYPFFVLMGAGDWWHLRSDGAGNWWPVGRYDNTPLGRPTFETTTALSPGGWVLYHGLIYNRTDWPWVWDHAQASGMLTTEAARVGKEGCWTEGDGVNTFRSPEGRAEFIRLLDESRGIDVGRTAGSSQGDAIRNITGAAASVYRSGSLVVSGAMKITAYGSSPAKIGVSGADPGDNSTIVFDASLAVPTASENRPRNIANPGRIKLI
jgi:hypothetical protein